MTYIGLSMCNEFYFYSKVPMHSLVFDCDDSEDALISYTSVLHFPIRHTFTYMF